MQPPPLARQSVMTRVSPRLMGIVIVLISAVMWSLAGPFVRMANLDIWSIVGWRSVFTALTLFVWIALRPPSEVPMQFGRGGMLVTLISTCASIAYVVALSWTTVANVMTIYATLPFIAGLIAFLWYRERVSGRFILAGMIALAGICTMVGGAAFTTRDLLGILIALVMTSAFALQLVVARRYPRLDSARMVAYAALLCIPLALPFMPLALPSGRALLACALYGAITTGLGYILVLIGGRLIGAGEAGFLSLIDVVLGPAWVWVFFGERMSTLSILSAMTVLGAVVWYLGSGGLARR